MALLDQYQLSQNPDFRGIIRAGMMNKAKEIIGNPSIVNANGHQMAKTVARGDGGTASAAVDQFAWIIAMDSRVTAQTAKSNPGTIPDATISAILGEYWNWVAGN